MAKKTHVKVRLVPESKPDSPFFYYVKKPAGGEKAKVKLSAKKYNPSTRKHETFVEKNFHLTVSNYFFLKLRLS
jgi:large subunit ribosomal protein L33